MGAAQAGLRRLSLRRVASASGGISGATAGQVAVAATATTLATYAGLTYVDGTKTLQVLGAGATATVDATTGVPSFLLKVAGATAGTVSIDGSGNFYIQGASNKHMDLGAQGSGSLRLATGAATRLTIDSSGDVSIGTAIDSSYRLKILKTGTAGAYVAGSGSGGGGLLRVGPSSEAESTTVEGYANDATGTLVGVSKATGSFFLGGSSVVSVAIGGVKSNSVLVFAPGNSEKMRIDSAGLAGIGAAAASGCRLHVTTAAEEKIQNENTNAAFYALIRNRNGGTDTDLFTFGNTYASAPHFGLTATSASTLVANGNFLAIGLTSAKPLHLATNNILRMTIAAGTVASAAGAVWDGIDHLAATLVVSGSTNITTATGVNFSVFRQPTISAASALTVDHAATVYIADAPAGAGAGPATVTNKYALWVDAGLVRLDGNGTHVLELPADATVGVGTVTGRAAIKVGADTKYLRYFDD